MKGCPGKLWRVDSLSCKTWEEFQQSKGWESLSFPSLNTRAGKETNYSTWPKSQTECKLTINRPSPEIRGKFPFRKGMTKQACHRGRQQQILMIFSMRYILVSKGPVPHGCLHQPGPGSVLQRINSCLCLSSCPQNSCWWCPRKVFLESGLTQAGVSLVAQTGRQPLSPSTQRRSLPFLTALCKTQNALPFLQLPHALLNACPFSKDALHFDLRQ